MGGSFVAAVGGNEEGKEPGAAAAAAAAAASPSGDGIKIGKKGSIKLASLGSSGLSPAARSALRDVPAFGPQGGALGGPAPLGDIGPGAAGAVGEQPLGGGQPPTKGAARLLAVAKTRRRMSRHGSSGAGNVGVTASQLGWKDLVRLA